jgi:tetratricopeptide (TPR) repeat protein
MSRRSTKRRTAARPGETRLLAGKLPGARKPPALKSEYPFFSWESSWLFCSFLIAATLVVYLPIWHAGFIWDDDILLTANPLVRDPHGWYRIWFATTTPDYFPMTATSFWLEWRLWGMNATGYHVTNVLLHAANAILLWRVLARLEIPGAKLASAIFALHPVNIASVAWIAERKNTLAMFFFLWALLCYLKFDDTKLRRWYWISLGTFILALLSKTAAAPLPLVLIGIGWWRHGQVGRKDILRTTAFFAVAGLLAIVTIWFQYHNAISHDIVRTDGFWSRLAIAGHAAWFYFYKAVFPVGLVPVYPRWQPGIVNLLSFIPALLLALGFVLCWRYRAGWGKPLLFGLGYSVVMLLPVLGFLNIYFFRYSLVADHWQYFAIIGVITLTAAGITTVLSSFIKLRTVFCGALLLLLGILTWRQVQIYHNAETLWEATLAGNPNCAVAHDGLGVVLLQSGVANEAIPHFRQAIQIMPDYAQAYYNLGNALAQEGSLDEAMTNYQAALQINPHYAVAYNNLGSVLAQEGSLDEAMTNYQAALQINPHYAVAYNNLGSVLLKKGSVDDAIGQFQKALRNNPDNTQAANNLGNALLQKGSVDEAISNLQDALRIDPDYADAHNNLGNALVHKGNLDEAITQFQKTLQIKPDDAEACYNLGGAFLQKGNLDDAITNFQRALKIKPVYAEADVNLGDALLQKGALDDAIAHFQEALRIKPNDAETHNNLGNALLQRGDVDEAVAQFKKALKVNPDYTEAYFNLGNILLLKGNTDEAITNFKRALIIKPDYADARNNLGSALLEKGNVAEAIKQFQEALQIDPNHLQTLNNLAWILATIPQDKLRDGNKAVALAQRANQLTGDSNPAILGTLAAAYAEAGQFPEAVETGQRALARVDAGTAQADTLQSQLKLYQKGIPFRSAE